MSKEIWTYEREQERKAKELVDISLDRARLVGELCERMDVTPPDLLVAATWAMAHTNIEGTLEALSNLSQAILTMCARTPDDPAKAN